jgi:hypothetical protein
VWHFQKYVKGVKRNAKQIRGTSREGEYGKVEI